MPTVDSSHAGDAPPRILVFDSGLGGLSVLREIKKSRPDCQLIYCSDNQAFPYGPQSEAGLIERVDRVLTHLVQCLAPDLIVIACNTASTVALPVLRKSMNVPIVGVVPAIKPAAKLAQTRYIGLLATPGTVKRAYTDKLIEAFGRGVQANPLTWIKVGSSALVTLAEEHAVGNTAAIHERVQGILEPFSDTPAGQLDTIVLACTHFPLVVDVLKTALPRVKNWVDSGQAIANRVDAWLTEGGRPKAPIDASEHFAVLTQALRANEGAIAPQAVQAMLLAEGLAMIRVIDVPQ